MGDAILPPRYGGYKPSPHGRKPLATPPKSPPCRGAASPNTPTGGTLKFIRELVGAWDCCGTCAGGVLARRDRERDAARDLVIPPGGGEG